MGDADLEMAAVIHPSFKLVWMDESMHLTMISKVKNKVHQLIEAEEQAQALNESSEESAEELSLEAVTYGKRHSRDFFAFSATKKRRSSSSKYDVIDSDISEYLKKDIVPFDAKLSIPKCLEKLYFLLNTAMPSSAGVERLFSLAGRVFSPLRSTLSDQNFEYLVFLKSNWELLNTEKDYLRKKK